MVLGSPGGTRIITTGGRYPEGVIDYDMGIQQAVNAPRFHRSRTREARVMEPGISRDTMRQLGKMGHAGNGRILE